MRGEKMMQRALTPESVESLIYSERGDEQARRLRWRNARMWTPHIEELDEEGWTRFWEYAEQNDITDGDEEEVGSNPVPPEICIKLRDCTLWCEPE
jgi:hypothetical protein